MKKIIFSIAILAVILPNLGEAKSISKTYVDALNVRIAYYKSVGDFKTMIADIQLVLGQLNFWKIYGEPYHEGSGSATRVITEENQVPPVETPVEPETPPSYPNDNRGGKPQPVEYYEG